MELHARPMTQGEFDDFLRRKAPAYANDLERTRGLTREDALAKSTKDFADQLPDGVDTERHALLAVVDASGRVVADLWFGPDPGERRGSVYLYDIEVFDGYRGRGLGRATMALFEELARQAGYARAGLHVFGDNEVARSLYRSTGYRETSITMQKEL